MKRQKEEEWSGVLILGNESSFQSEAAQITYKEIEVKRKKEDY
jgi:hypothetical protein